MKHSLSILIVISFLNSGAQTFQWGKTFVSKTEIEGIIGSDENQIYSHSKRAKNHYINVYDNNLDLNRSRLINLEEEAEIMEILMIDEQITILNYIHDRDNKEVRLYANSINKNGTEERDNKLIMIITLEKNRLM